MLAVMVARFPLATIYAGRLIWVPATLLVAFALGMVAVTVKAMWTTLFSEPAEDDEADEIDADEDDEPCLPDGTPIYRSRKLTRTEREQGMADRGCDTLEEARSER